MAKSRTRKPSSKKTKPQARPKDDPFVKLRDAVLEMSAEIEQACSQDRRWTSWKGNGVNCFEASQVIRCLKDLADECP